MNTYAYLPLLDFAQINPSTSIIYVKVMYTNTKQIFFNCPQNMNVF